MYSTIGTPQIGIKMFGHSSVMGEKATLKLSITKTATIFSLVSSDIYFILLWPLLTGSLLVLYSGGWPYGQQGNTSKNLTRCGLNKHKDF